MGNNNPDAGYVLSFEAAFKAIRDKQTEDARRQWRADLFLLFVTYSVVGIAAATISCVGGYIAHKNNPVVKKIEADVSDLKNAKDDIAQEVAPKSKKEKR